MIANSIVKDLLHFWSISYDTQLGQLFVYSSDNC